MDRTTNFLSELEAELELEFDSERKNGNDSELDSEFELELDNEYGNDRGQDNEFEFELDSEADNELEMESSDGEFEFEYGDSSVRNYESRLYQLLNRRGGENELEFDQELNQVIHDMEQEFFFKGLKKWARKGLKKFKSIAGMTPLGQFVNVATSLARGNVRDLLRKAAGFALRSGAGFIPGGSMLAPVAAKALNLETGMDQETPSQKARSIVQLAQKSYQNLAQQLDPRMANPRMATQLAKMAVQHAMAGVSHNGSTHAHRNGAVVYVSAATWNKVKNGGSLIIKLRQG